MEARQRNQTLELKTEPTEVILEKVGPKPKMVRFESVLMMLRLRVKLMMRLMDYVARELGDVGELSLLTSRQGQSCFE